VIRRLGWGDTEEMSRERAEAYLRLLAEEELRRPAWPRRVRWTAELLIAMGALDDEVADRGVHPHKGRWPPLARVITEPGLQAGSRDLP